MSASKQPNRLIRETSPYLLQHAHNPVDWYPWGSEAHERAKRENKPIFLSVGYSACHWCHVMERESFENAEIARAMNEWFVNVKVDREERPDLDDIYMKAVHAMTGAGGWPMSAFLTPDLEPFYGGTYFPPEGRYGRPGFRDVLRAIHENWERTPEKLKAQGKRLTEMIEKEARADTSAELDPGILERCFQQLYSNFDPTWGGFGHSPKFPHAIDLRLCLREWKRTGNPLALEVATTTLDRMSEGGVYDQLGGGFHRYSTDEMWLVPHFEKMLYDNALLVPAYLDAFLVTGRERYARVARECCEWMLAEMQTPEGGFASTQDADTEGEEGLFFTWTPAELDLVLGERLGRWAAEWYGVTPEGNFEHGRSALWRHQEAADIAARLSIDKVELIAAMQGAREKLLVARAERVRPSTDDKTLAAWNGLAISALAQAFRVLGDERHLDAARGAANHVLGVMRQPDGRLFATSRGGRTHLNAYLPDYAYTIAALIDLYESDFDERWLREASKLDDVLEERFLDRERGGYFMTGEGHEELIARLKEPHDGALPAANGVQVGNLIRMAELLGQPRLASLAQTCITSMGDLANRYPSALTQLLLTVDHIAAGGREIVIAGELGDPLVQAMLSRVRGTYLPQRVVALAHSGADPELLPLLRGRTRGADGPRAYVCRNYTCGLPLSTAEELAEALR